MDFGCFWKAPVRSEENQQRGEGKSICPALASHEGMILWRKRPCVDRIFGIVPLLSHGTLNRRVRSNSAVNEGKHDARNNSIAVTSRVPLTVHP